MPGCPAARGAARAALLAGLALLLGAAAVVLEGGGLDEGDGDRGGVRAPVATWSTSTALQLTGRSVAVGTRVTDAAGTVGATGTVDATAARVPGAAAGHAFAPTTPARIPASAGPGDPAGDVTGDVTDDASAHLAPRGGWARPVPGPVLHEFDPPAERWQAGHRGVDLAAAAGEPVRSPADGTVSFAGSVAGKPVVVVTHAGGLRSTFEPVTAGVDLGAAVNRGDTIGSLADAPGHCAPAGCLHWGVLRGDVYLDPLALVGEDAPIVLLPGGP